MSIESALNLGLSEEEYQIIVNKLQREPNFEELGVFSAMWSEHCSYKTSKKYLSRLPTTADWVVCGPGEGGGVIDIGDGQVAIFKMESHNHPSFISPYNGSATGVGGVMRDIFTMGARPVANLNALRFGSIENEKTRFFLGEVVSGIGDYGNCVGVPMLGGATGFDSGYDENILVNAMCVGIANKDEVVYAKPGKLGNRVIYAGSPTGKDGVDGARMSSSSFEEENKKPNIPVGDPFTEKLLMESCLEIKDLKGLVGMQDMGAAGLTCASVEIAEKGGVGISIDLDKVPCRHESMSTYEFMLSETQERMLFVIEPGYEKEMNEIFNKWQVEYSDIGEITDTGMFEVYKDGERDINIPISLFGEVPIEDPI